MTGEPVAVFFTYEIEPLGVDYGTAAYRDVVERIGERLLRDIEFHSGDSAMTLEGGDNAYIVAVCGEPDRVEEIFSRCFVFADRGSRALRNLEKAPLRLGFEADQQPLVFNGLIDAKGVVHPYMDGSLLNFLVKDASK